MRSFLKQKPFIVPAALLLGILFYFPVFLHLENLVIEKHDEGRLANNAYEMSRDGNYIVTHFEGEPEMWNTKPPLMIWAQVFFIKMVGYNELAIRLPAALAALITCLAMIIFSYRYFKRIVFGIIAALVLITSTGFIGIHFSRTGDYDSLLTLFTLLSLLFFFISIESTEKRTRNKYLGLFFLSLTLATLTKGVAGLLFIPALAVYTLIRKQFIPLLKNKLFYVFLLSFILPVISYYLVRESMNPGYIEAVFSNELGGRFMETIEGHKHGVFYYYDYLREHEFKHWFIFVLPGILTGFVSAEKRIKSFSIFLFLLILSFMLIISNAQTKIFWYVMPVVPLLAFSAALFFYWLFSVLENLSSFFPASKYNIAPYIFLFFIFRIPYADIFNDVYHPREPPWEKEESVMSYYLRNSLRGERNIAGSFIVREDYHADNTFYVNQLKEKNQMVAFKNRDEVLVNDTVIVYNEDIKVFIGNKFETEVLDQWKTVDHYRIISECP